MTRKMPAKINIDLDFELHDRFKIVAKARGYNNSGHPRGRYPISLLRKVLLERAMELWMEDITFIADLNEGGE